MSKEISIYDYMRDWFDFCFENTEMIKPNHSALYFFILSHSNRMGWKPKFGLPTTMAKEAIGIRSYNTYIETLSDLIDFGFIKLLEKSKNQYSSNIIALSKYNKATIKALDKATMKHSTKQLQSIEQSTDSIIIQDTNTQINNSTIKRFTPPTLDLVISYFTENGYTEQSAKKAFDYYTVADWKDSKGNKVKNWKQKMQGVWFKPQNELRKINAIPAHNPNKPLIQL